MTNTNEKSKYYIITKQKQLKAYLDTIKDEKILFIDTEFHREKTYYATLCLIQIATENTLVAIDPLVNNLDLTALVDFLNNDEILKVFHAGKQDLEIFYRLNNQKPIKNIFDTQIASLALGLGDQIGYANLVKSILNIDLDKSQQVANWQNRPMSEEQLEYAMADVIYLKEIYHKLIKRLTKKNRLDLINKEMLKLEENSYLAVNTDNIYKNIKLRDKSPITMTILKELAKFREIEAQRSNKFRNAVLRDEFLSYCARLKPTTIEDLELVRGVSKKILSKYGTSIVKIINDVYKMKKSDLVKAEKEVNLPIVDSHIKTLANFLLQMKAKEHEISLKLITDTTDLTFFLASDKEPSKLRESWRWEMFGQYLEKLRKGELLIGIDGKKVVFIETENKKD
ncbi:MAG: Ribonuclease D [Proteobacteria bacterium]|nr:MAG: Ribonuclease D [Pseudomonadota bacterium]